MIIHKNAVAGTLESSDILVVVQPAEHGIHIELQSTVYQQFGDDIIKTICEVTESLGVEAASIQANDHGALDCTIRARLRRHCAGRQRRKLYETYNAILTRK